MKKTALGRAAAVTLGVTAVAPPSQRKRDGVAAGVLPSPAASLAQPSSVD